MLSSKILSPMRPTQHPQGRKAKKGKKGRRARKAKEPEPEPPILLLLLLAPMPPTAPLLVPVTATQQTELRPVGLVKERGKGRVRARVRRVKAPVTLAQQLAMALPQQLVKVKPELKGRGKQAPTNLKRSMLAATQSPSFPAMTTTRCTSLPLVMQKLPLTTNSS